MDKVEQSPSNISTSRAVTVLIVTWLAMFLVALFAPFHLLDNDQQRPAAYAMDIVHNGSWLLQVDDQNEVASKPPLYNYVIAISAISTGRLNAFSLYLPGALAILGTGLLLFFVTRRFLDPWGAFLAALFWILSGTSMKHIILARSDALFSFFVFSACCIVVYAGMKKANWLLFWIAVSLATFTKGPLGLLLGIGGIPLLIWHSKFAPEGERLPFKLGKWQVHALGLGIFVLLNAGWLLTAFAVHGDRVFDKLIGKELIGHVVTSDDEGGIGSKFFNPLLYFISRSLPWSLLALIGFYRLAVAPPKKALTRWFLRYMSVFFLVALAIFSLAAHKRADHLLPIIPAAMVLAGWQAAAFWRPDFLTRKHLAAYAGIVILFLSVSVVRSHILDRDDKVISHGQYAIELANDVREVDENFPLTHADSLYAIQYELNTFRRRTDEKWSSEALADEPAVFVVVSEGLMSYYMMWLKGAHYYTLASYGPADGQPVFRILSNKEELRYYDKMAFFANHIKITMENLTLLSRGDKNLEFVKVDPSKPASLELKNFASGTRTISTRLKGSEWSTHSLGYHEIQSMNWE